MCAIAEGKNKTFAIGHHTYDGYIHVLVNISGVYRKKIVHSPFKLVPSKFVYCHALENITREFCTGSLTLSHPGALL